MAPTPHQLRCIKDTFAAPVAVVAGAGSGKTDTLTRRVVYALEHPERSGCADIDDILAITYTNKAAGELKSRIKEALEEAATPQNGLALQALKVDGAWISTIHGMCSRILRENAFTFGVDPAFGILMDEARDGLLDEAVEEVLARSDAEGAALFDEYRRSTVKEMLIQLVDAASQSPVPARELFCLQPRCSGAEALMRLVLCTQEALGHLDAVQSQTGKPPSKTALAYIDGASRALAAVLQVPEGEAPTAAIAARRLAQLKALEGSELLRLADAFPKFPGRVKAAKEPLGSAGLLPQAALAQCAADLYLSVATPFLDTLVGLVPRVQRAFVERKRAAGVLDNDDLLTMTARLLSDESNRAVAERYHRQFKLVMVDEFQDTNQMQVDMINLVAGGAPEAGGLSPKLCVVGDAQQSIYRFRNADLGVFKDHVAKVQAHPSGQRIELGDNFRSHGEILAFSKGVFSSVFGSDYLDLLHGRDEERAAAGNPCTPVLEDPRPGEPRRVNVAVFGARGNGGISERAASHIARDFKTLADRGVPPGAMAVLLGTMTHADIYAQALQEAGLPCAVTGGSVFKRSPQAQLVSLLLFVLANPCDTESLAAVLAGPLFCLPADDLLALVTIDPEAARGRLSDGLLAAVEERPLPSGSPLLENALAVLGRALGKVGQRPVASLLEDILVESGWLDRLGFQEQAQAADAFKAIRMVRTIEGEGGLGPLAIARRFKAHLEAAKEAPGVLSAEGGDFVRIMTIHASKGLSIPVVAVAEAEFSQNKRSCLKMLSQDGRIYLSLLPQASREGLSGKLLEDSLDDYRSKGQPAATVAEAQAVLDGPSSRCGGPADFALAIERLNLQGDFDEHQRKLYVAFTRAKEALIVTMRKLPKKPSISDDDTPDVSRAIAELLTGDAAAPEFTEAAESLADMVCLHTAYEDAPAYDLDWGLRFEVVPAPAEEAEDADEAGEEEPCTSDAPAPAPPVTFVLPRSLDPWEAPSVPYKAAWAEGILSASSLSRAAGLPDPDDDTAEEEEPVDGADVASDPALSEGGEAEEPACAADRGTAFHALAEWSVIHRGPDGRFPAVPEERIRAIGRLHGLNDSQCRELRAPMERWLGSPQASEAMARATVKAEQPFWVPLEGEGAEGPGSRPLVLQGFIDLLAYDELGCGRAYAVDYKTGTHLRTDAQRRRAYGIQAACYAYALLLQGFEEVVLDFVFVDQPASDGSGHPQVVRFPAPDEPPYTLENIRSLILNAAQGTKA